MIFNVIENKERKTITVILGGVRFYSAKYLLERYDEKRYFGNGILKITKDEMGEILKKVSASLNLVNPEVRITPKLLFEGDDNKYPLFKHHYDQDGEWDKTYEVALSALSDKKERDLFFSDLARTKPVRNEDVVKEHEWGVEIEITSRIDEETLDPKIFVILHRIIKGKKAETTYQSNDNAWGGFDFGGVEEEENVLDKKVLASEEDLPF